MADVDELLAEVTDDADAFFLFSPSGSYYDRYADLDADATLVVVAPENTVGADAFVELPLEFDDVRDRVRFGVEGGMEQGLVDDGDVVVCTLSMFEEGIDTVTRARANESMHSGVYDLFANSRADAGVIRDVFEVAIELGRKGQKGKPVGALFVVGDAGKVMNKSRPLSYNPFEKSHVHVGDPIVNVMLKEFSRLDGAFVISDAGKIVSAYRYLEPSAEGVDIPKGLGTRHMAAAGITRETNATAIVLSESDGLVRAFKGGELVLELDPGGVLMVVALQLDWSVLLREEFQYVLALLILILGGLAGYVIGRLNHRLLTAAGVPEAVERTPFERTAQSLGTDTVTLVARLSSWFIYGVVVLISLNVAELLNARLFWNGVLTFIPDLFIAILVFIVGFVVADKAELVVSERLRSIKLPEVGVIPRLIKYTIVFLAALVALGQVGVAVEGLLVLLAAYALAIILFAAIAFWDLLRSSAAGVYLLLNQPYGIGDEIEVGEDRGIVQEVDVFVTRIENDGEEYIVPNSRVFEHGVVRVRE